MKKKYFAITLLLSVIITGCNKEDIEQIPTEAFSDELFEKYLLKNFDIDNDGQISIAEAKAVKEIDCSDMNIISLKGIHHFTELEKLNCSNNKLRDLDVSKNTSLKELLCSYSLNSDSLDFSYNAKLEALECSGNGIKHFNLRNNVHLKKLDCSDNYEIKNLDLSNNTELKIINCSNLYQLTYLDLSKNKKLEEFYFINTSGNDQLESLDFNNSSLMTFKLMSAYKLKSINFSGCNQLVDVYCENTGYVEDNFLNFDGCSSLEYLSIINCSFTSLDIRPCIHLKELRYSGDVDISNNTELEYVFLNYGSLLAPIPNNTKIKALSFHSIINTDILDLSNQLLLENLRCSDINFIDISKNKSLKYVHIGGVGQEKGLSELYIKDYPDLIEFTVYYTKHLSAFELENCPKLKNVSIDRRNWELEEGYYPYLDTLIISNCESLNRIHCDYSLINTLIINQCPNIDSLSCAGNKITELYLDDFTKLKYLQCEHNKLSKLDVSKNIELEELRCQYSDRIKELDVRNNSKLKILLCENNKNLEYLYIKKGHKFNNLSYSGMLVYVD